MGRTRMGEAVDRVGLVVWSLWRMAGRVFGFGS